MVSSGEGSKVCTTCKIRKPFSDFHKMRNGWKTKCKDCCSKHNANYWLKNKGQKQTLARERRKKNAEAGQILVRAYLELYPCADCGIDDWRVLEFDHVRGEKLGNICNMMTGDLDRLEQEILKCDVVCANCHKIRTFTRAGSWRMIEVSSDQ